MPNHLEFIGEDYFTHLFNGLKYSSLSMYASVVFFIHAFIPDILTSEGSDTIFSLSAYLYKRLYKLQERKCQEISYDEEKMNIV
jgi:hypothetical protein